MQFSEAFRALGYEVASYRTDWSAENADGVCLSLWSQELRPKPNGSLSFNTARDAKPVGLWSHKPGAKLRLAHLQRAVDEFAGRVDVILVSGTPGGGFGTAQPWRPEREKAAWWVTEFDGRTGHFAVETRPLA